MGGVQRLLSPRSANSVFCASLRSLGDLAQGPGPEAEAVSKLRLG